MMPEISPAAAGASSSDLLDSVFPDSSPSTEQPQSGDPAGEAEDPAMTAAAGAETEDPFSLEHILDDEEAEPEQVDENGRNAYKMSADRMARFVQAKKLQDGIAEFAPSVEAARQHYERASDFDTMESDFRNPGEMVDHNGQQVPAARAWLEHWAGVSPEGIGAVAEMLPQFLAESGNTQTLSRLEGVFSRGIVGGLYNKAARSGDPEDLARAQNADFALHGKFREKIEAPQQRTAQDSLQQREQQIQQRENATVAREWKAFDSQHLSGAKDAAMKSSLDSIFEKPEIKGAFPASILAAVRNQVATEIQQRLASDQEWNRNHGIRLRDIQSNFTQAVRSNKETNLTPQAKALVDDYSAKVRREIFAVAKPLLRDATQNAVKSNQAVHQRFAAGAARTAPSGSGSPVRRSIAPVPRGQSSRELIDSALD